jgi:hypothetical protein
MPASAPHPLLAKVERHLAATGLSAAAFGKSVLGDPRFVYQLRKGREPRRRTVETVTEAIQRAKQRRPEAAD